MLPSQVTQSPSSTGRSLLKHQRAAASTKQVEFRVPAPEQASLFLTHFSCYKETKLTAMLLCRIISSADNLNVQIPLPSQALNVGEQAGPCTPPQPPMAAGADKRGCSPAPAAQDAASRSSGAHVARCFQLFSLLVSSPAFLCHHGSAKRGH